MAHTGTSTIDIDATCEDLMAIVCDLESYPEWVSDVKQVEIHESDAEGRPLSSTMTVDVTIREVTYTLDYSYEGDERMSWKSRPGGDVKHIEGSYTFEINDDGGTTVTYDLAIDPGFPVPGFLLKRAAKHIAAAALDGLKARAEED
ncbi:MAG: SRPBCC family protein [Thermoleophilia bacterium]|nr:SRPBCC family protein [Thermoleophilia bacterium]